VNVLDNYVTNQIPLLGRGLGGGLNGKMIIAIIEAIPSIKNSLPHYSGNKIQAQIMVQQSINKYHF
tara:strand:+ start:56 stop:253 length:198 start_codon:yes stop_codon:yes gene_type:complete